MRTMFTKNSSMKVMTTDWFDGRVARWRGREYEASPDGDRVRVYQAAPGEGFDEVRPGRFVRALPAADIENLVYVRTMCSGAWWRLRIVGFRLLRMIWLGRTF